MDLNLEQPGDHHYIRSFNEQGIRIRERFYTCSLLLSATRLLTDWPPQNVDQLEDQHLEAIFSLQPEVVLIGSGSQQVFLPPRLMVMFYERGTGVEVMTTDAACRTFNVLVSEGRNVVGAFMQG